jgi:hypothetical protein
VHGGRYLARFHARKERNTDHRASQVEGISFQSIFRKTAKSAVKEVSGALNIKLDR